MVLTLKKFLKLWNSKEIKYKPFHGQKGLNSVWKLDKEWRESDTESTSGLQLPSC